MTTGNSPATQAGERDIIITRTFDAPRDLVWSVWTDPAHLTRWWGPKAFTAPVCKIDLRVGGRYLYCMRSPDGQDYWSTGVFREIVEPERIVCTDSFADEHGNEVPASYYGMPGDWPAELLVTITFDEHDGKTTLTLRHAGIPAGEMQEQTEAGWNESLDKLAEELARARREIVVSRRFDAPRELVFSTWTDRDNIGRWWGPDGFTITTHEMDVRPGGVWRFVMHGPDGADYPNRIRYDEILRPERLVYGHGSGEGEDLDDFQTTVTFAEDGGGTLLTMRLLFPTAADRDRAVEQYNAIEGGKQTLGRLAEYLASK